MRRTIPERFLKEQQQFVEQWFASDLSLDEAIEKFASEAYKKYLKRSVARAERLRKKGIIVN